MGSDSNKKKLLIYILKILQEYTDENHTLTQTEIANKIYNIYDMQCDRKSIAANIECLLDLEYDIQKTKKGCFLGEREFESSEVSYLIDSVFSNKSISSKQAQNLCAKLNNNLSKYQKQDFRYVFKASEISRSSNKQLFFNIETIHSAIKQNKQIAFHYTKYNINGELEIRKKGKKYIANPYFMVNNKGVYYLVCNIAFWNEIANYKIDQMINIDILETERKDAKQLDDYHKIEDISKYINNNVYMFADDVVDAKVLVDEEYVINYIYEWFGKNVYINKNDNKIIANIKSSENAIIYWCLQYGNSVQIIEPTQTRQKIKKIVEKMHNNYKG